MRLKKAIVESSDSEFKEEEQVFSDDAQESIEAVSQEKEPPKQAEPEHTKKKQKKKTQQIRKRVVKSKTKAWNAYASSFTA